MIGTLIISMYVLTFGLSFRLLRVSEFEQPSIFRVHLRAYTRSSCIEKENIRVNSFYLMISSQLASQA